MPTNGAVSAAATTIISAENIVATTVNCTASATAKNNGDANAECTTDGGFVNATATNGGEANGTDTGPPICNANGGTAKVRSTGGNCG